MIRKYGKWIFLVMLCLGVAFAGCAPKKVTTVGAPTGLSADYDEAKSLFQEATDMGGKDCAPVEYATAQAYMDHVEHEWKERHWDDAAESIAFAKQKSMEAIEKCKEKEVVEVVEVEVEEEEVVAPAVRPEFEFAPIYFDVRKADIRSDAIVVLDRLGMILKENPWLEIEVSGHSDSGGSEEANMDLSVKRAESVSTYLIDHYAISPHRLRAVGYGESRPVADNSTREGRRMNRRVEFRTIEE